MGNPVGVNKGIRGEEIYSGPYFIMGGCVLHQTRCKCNKGDLTQKETIDHFWVERYNQSSVPIKTQNLAVILYFRNFSF